jgi:transcriptional regulator with XRE-family HTH domain
MRKFDNKKLDKLLSPETVNVSGVARQAGISNSTLIQLRNGDTSPRANTLVALADLFNVPMDYFFTENYRNNDKQETA